MYYKLLLSYYNWSRKEDKLLLSENNRYEKYSIENLIKLLIEFFFKYI